jgi:hypothetical protein
VIGHNWEQAEGTVLHRYDSYSGLPGRHGSHVKEVYDVEVRKPDGTTDQAQVPSTDYRHLSPGTIVRLEVHGKTGEVKLHPHLGQLVIGFDSSTAAASSGFGGSAASPAPTGAPGFNMAGMNVGDVLGGSFPAGMQMQIGGHDMTDVLSRLRSGDPAQRSAAMAELRNMRDQLIRGAQGQAAGSVVFTSTEFGQPAGFGQPGSGQPAQSDSGGRRSPAERLAMLQEMVDRGQLSQAEFDTKRQQILDEI